MRPRPISASPAPTPGRVSPIMNIWRASKNGAFPEMTGRRRHDRAPRPETITGLRPVAERMGRRLRGHRQDQSPDRPRAAPDAAARRNAARERDPARKNPLPDLHQNGGGGNVQPYL